jgi:hypothetical protein
MVSLFKEISVSLALASEEHLEPATAVPNKYPPVSLVFLRWANKRKNQLRKLPQLPGESHSVI